MDMVFEGAQRPSSAGVHRPYRPARAAGLETGVNNMEAESIDMKIEQQAPCISMGAITRRNSDASEREFTLSCSSLNTEVMRKIVEPYVPCASNVIIAEQWWVPPRDEKWFYSLGGPLSKVIVDRSGRPCSLVRRSSFCVAVKWDPEGRSNLRGELLSVSANRLNQSLGNQAGHPMCVQPQVSSVTDLTWGTPAASSRLLD
ncbi:hypothetical protein M0804_013952 [Polistes exclamans]|nr:hypothetical protein M0804_013952 [Polistes exclamans]